MDRQDYEERYGEVVGRCNIHNIQVIDNSCDACEEEQALEHECKDFVSQCCSGGKHEYVEDVCGKCLDNTGFECLDCGKLENEYTEKN